MSIVNNNEYNQRKYDRHFNYITRLIVSVILPILTSFLLVEVNNFVYLYAELSESTESHEVFLPHENPFGSSYAEWSAIWWKWLLASPIDINPATDKTGQYCNQNQNNPDVWFLAGTSGGYEERKCSIPQGKAILVSPIEVICTFAEFPELKTEEDLRTCAKSDQDAVINVKLSIDSKFINDIQNYRFSSSLFNVTLPENNILGVSAQTTQAVSDGTFVMLKELPVGHHTIYASGVLVDLTTTSNLNFVSEVKYDIDVVPEEISIK